MLQWFANILVVPLLWIYFVIACLIVFLTWKTFFTSFNIYRDFTEFGYENACRQSGKSDLKKKRIINELRKRRRIGDLPPVYPNGWFAILESDQLPVKSVKAVDVLGLNLVVWRGESGKCYVGDAYCPHLGAHLGVGGTVRRECVECPFHGWSFAGCTGKLTNIPYADKTPEFIKLKTWASVEKHGFVYIWHHSENEEPTWFPEDVPQIQTNEWKYRGRSEFLVNCHIQEIPENGADVAHLNVVHADPFFKQSIWGCGGLIEKFLKHGWSGSWQVNEDKMKHVAVLHIKHCLQLFNRFSFLHINVDVQQVGPGIVLMKFDSVMGTGVLVQTVTPIEPLLQRVTHRFYTSPTFIQPFANLVLQGEAEQIARDIAIWNRKTFLSRPTLVKEDKFIKSFRKWYSQFYSESSPKYQIILNKSTGNQLEI